MNAISTSTCIYTSRPSTNWLLSVHRTCFIPMLGVLAILTSGCAAQNVNLAGSGQPFDPYRVIAKVIRDAGMEPTAARKVEIAPGKNIYVDFGIEGHDFGIAFVEPEEAARLQDAIPAYKPGREQRLHIARGGANGETRILVLHSRGYEIGTSAGAGHSTEDALAWQAQQAQLEWNFGAGMVFSFGAALVSDEKLEHRSQEAESSLSTDVLSFLNYARAKAFK